MPAKASQQTPPQTPPPGPATVKQFLAISEHSRFHELIDGQLVQRALPTWTHQRVQKSLLLLLNPYDRKSVKGRRGGWFILSDVEIRFDNKNIFRPDVAGWRRETFPTDIDLQTLLTVRPDWACEVVSASNRNNDLVTKYNKYAKYGITHYWLVEPRTQQLTALRLQAGVYVEVGRWTAKQTVRAEPFAETPIVLSRLFALNN